jgi:WD40 repeat protein
MLVGTRVFRVFVSSTFRDLRPERDALQERVFPELRAYCAAKGYAFQAIDLRWGIRDEVSAGQRTMRICLSEVARCQEVSPRPNFVVLLGDRYGWRPLPEVIDAKEFKTLKSLLAPADVAAAEAAYYRDDNAVPPEYVLKPHRESQVSYDAETLREALADAAKRAGLPEAALVKYTLSATEQEILKGAFEAEGADEHVFCFLRDLSGLPDRVPPLPDDPELWPPAAHYRDFHRDGTPDEEAMDLLSDLKSRLRQQLGDNEARRYRGLGDNAFAYQAEWSDAGPSTGHIDQLCRDMLVSLKRVIDAEIERLGAYSHLEQERAVHGAFAQEHAAGFIGRVDYLKAIARYLDSDDDHPLCVFAAGGLGKSALMARAATDAARDRPNTVMVTRFIGATSASADPRSLLQDLCSEIGEAYGSTEPVPSTLQDLQREFPERLKLASADRPLIVFLDSLDQLSAGSGTSLPWLPSDLPGNVRIVVTTRPGAFLGGLRSRLPQNLAMELDKMPPDEGEILLDSWLGMSRRVLTPGQRQELLDRFAASGSPLYLRLAFEEARLWPSTLEGMRLGNDEPSIIGDLYDRLEAEHGAELVGHALGFLACTYEHLGLSEDELLDTLAADDETWTEFTAGAKWEMPVRQLPVVVWSRLYFDLAPYLSPRSSEGASLLSFFHKELADAAQNRYVEGRAAHLHDVVAQVMQGLARGKDAGVREWKGSAHALAELPYHLTGAERWDDLFATLTDFTYLEEKAKRVAVVTSADADGNGGVYSGVLTLMDDYDRALAAFPANQALVGSPTTARSDQRLVLEAFGKVLGREAHNLTPHPDLLWQQMYNRLQWVDGPEKDGVVSRVLAPEFEEHSKPGARLWLHSLTRLHESEALIRTLTGHTGIVWAVAYSADGTRIVSVSSVPGEPFTLKVWDAHSGAELSSGEWDKALKVRDAATGAELATLSGHMDTVPAVAYSPDGTRIVSQANSRERSRSVKVSDHTMTIGEKANLEVRDAATGAKLATLTAHTDNVHAIAYSPDGTRFVSGSNDKTLKIWDAASGAELATLSGHTDWVSDVAYSPDGTRIVSGSSDKTLKIWNAAATSRLFRPCHALATLTAHTDNVHAIAYSPDGTRIVSGSNDKTLKIWDAASGAELATLSGHADTVLAVAYSPDGTRIVSGSSDKTLKIWNADSGVELATPTSHTGDVNAVAYSPDGTRFVSGSGHFLSHSGDNTLKIWHADSGVELATLSGHTGEVNAVAYSPDGTRIVSGSEDETVKVWDADSGTELTTLGHTNAVRAVAYSPDGNRIVTVMFTGNLNIWDAAARSRPFHPCQPLAGFMAGGFGGNGVAYSPDGTRILSGSGLGSTVWDAASGVPLARLSWSAASHRVTAVAYSPDGTRFVSGSPEALKISDADSGAELVTLTGHTGEVNAVAYSPDGTRIVSGSGDMTLRVWDARKMVCIAILPCLGSVGGCDYSPQGTRICCGDASGTVYILELMGESLHPRPEAKPIESRQAPDRGPVASEGQRRWWKRGG